MYEDNVKTWKNLGYSTAKLEKGTYESLETIKSRFDEFGQHVDKNQATRLLLQNLKNTHKKILVSPRFASRVTIIEQKIADPDESAFVKKRSLVLKKRFSRFCTGKKNWLKKSGYISKKLNPALRSANQHEKC